MIFVDTGAFVARYLERDQYHDRAREGWERIARERPPLVTSHDVLDETLTLLARRAGAGFAAERGRRLLASPSLELLRSTAETEAQALRLLERYADQRLSFTDCLSFALMRRQAIARAFTFDRHFALAGFEIWPLGV